MSATPSFQVLTYTVCDGWVNCWHLDDEPQTFPSETAAEAAIEEYLADCEASSLDVDPADLTVAPYHGDEE